MSNLSSALKSEITLLARKEFISSDPLRKMTTASRREIAESSTGEHPDE